MSENPYAAPTTPSFSLESQAPTSDYTRRTYLKHEASVKSIGTIFFLGGLIMGGAMIFSLVYTAREAPFSIPIILGLLALVIFQISVAIGLRKLKSWARIPAIILSCLGLFGIPIGTLISAYFLYLLGSKKGSMIFSSKYAQVMADTPHIRYRTSILVWILLTIILVVIVIGIITSAPLQM